MSLFEKPKTKTLKTDEWQQKNKIIKIRPWAQNSFEGINTSVFEPKSFGVAFNTSVFELKSFGVAFNTSVFELKSFGVAF